MFVCILRAQLCCRHIKQKSSWWNLSYISLKVLIWKAKSWTLFPSRSLSSLQLLRISCHWVQSVYYHLNTTGAWNTRAVASLHSLKGKIKLVNKASANWAVGSEVMVQSSVHWKKWNNAVVHLMCFFSFQWLKKIICSIKLNFLI